MCWTPELVEFPCLWKDPEQDNFEELGIEPTTSKGTVLLDVKSIIRANESDEPNTSTVEISGDRAWLIQMHISKVKQILQKCGVTIKTAEEVLAE